MEAKYVKVPFDLNLAKQISSGNIEGKIWDERNYCNVRIIDFNYNTFYGKFNVFVSEVGENSEILSVCNDYGYIYYEKTKEFDKSRVLMLKLPFKDGDILISYLGNPFIFDGNIDKAGNFGSYCGINCNGELVFDSNEWTSRIQGYANEKQKNILIGYLKRNPNTKAQEYLKRFFPNLSNSLKTGKNCEFKPFDKVLVRDSIGETWVADIFSNYRKDTDYSYTTLGGSTWKCCIPYNEQTAYLLGTTNSPE